MNPFPTYRLQACLQKPTAVAGNTTIAKKQSCPFTQISASSTATSLPCLTVTVTISKEIYQYHYQSNHKPPAADLSRLFEIMRPQVSQMPEGGERQHIWCGGIHLLQPTEDELLWVLPPTSVHKEELVWDVSEALLDFGECKFVFLTTNDRKAHIFSLSSSGAESPGLFVLVLSICPWAFSTHRGTFSNPNPSLAATLGDPLLWSSLKYFNDC